jgi:pyruvate/2-oxoglutarate dehydrogenase complex dihydrolipoamide acyltransferase (E2) component
MPKFGLTMHEGTIQRFFKGAGERVNAGDPLYEVETEKVLYEVEAPASGVVATTLFAEGDTVECGVAVAVIAEAGEDADAIAARYREQATAPAARRPPKADAALPARSRANSRLNSASISTRSMVPVPADASPAKTSSAPRNLRPMCNRSRRCRPAIASRFAARAR